LVAGFSVRLFFYYLQELFIFEQLGLGSPDFGYSGIGSFTNSNSNLPLFALELLLTHNMFISICHRFAHVRIGRRFSYLIISKNESKLLATIA
jgi:hypothetical protein